VPPKRRRDYAAEYRRRQAKAKAAGFRNYYAQRTKGATGQRLREARGHSGPKDLERTLRSGKVAVVSQEPLDRDPSTGQWRKVKVRVMTQDGKTREFTIRGKTLSDPAELQAAVLAAGVDIHAGYTDVLGLAPNDLDAVVAHLEDEAA